MEDTAVPLHSWFWMFVPMITVFVLSIVNYLRNRNSLMSGSSSAPHKADENHT